MAESYRHTQVGWLIVFFFSLGVLFAGAILWPLTDQMQVVAVALVIMVIIFVVLLLFSMLTVTIDDKNIRVAFTFGLIRKTIALDEVRSFSQVRNPWYYGWGIRLIPGGWMYNVSGLSAVELILKSGKVFRIGTDQPQELHKALEKILGHPTPLSPQEQEQSRAGVRKTFLAAAAIFGILVLGLGVMLYFFMQQPSVRVGPSSFAVDSFMYGEEFPLAGVIDVSLEQHLPAIRLRTNGFALGETLRGYFLLDKLGKGKLFIQYGHPPYVLVKYKSGFVIINFARSEQTIKLYGDLMRAWKPD